MSGALLQMTGPVVDLLYEVAALPASGEEAVVTGFAMEPGGGFNAMVAARAAGMAVICGGTLGTGPFADLVRQGLAAHDIVLARPPDGARDTGCCTVLIEPSGERSFVAAEGAEGYMRPADLAGIDMAPVGWVLMSGYSLHYAGARVALSDWTRSVRAPVIFDPSPLVAELSADVLRPVLGRATWISANRREAAFLTGLDDPRAAARALADGRPADGRATCGAVVRDGASGCVVAWGGAGGASSGARQIPPHPVRAIDTNGAGDTHIGSFVARLAETGDPIAAARYANVAAALSTTRKGPATAPARATVDRILTESPAG